MRNVPLVCIVGATALASPTMPAAHAGPPKDVWALSATEDSCSMLKLGEKGFMNLAVRADGRNSLRLHAPDWQLTDGQRYRLRATVTDRTFDMDANGAVASDGTPGFVATSFDPVVQAIARASAVTIVLDAQSPRIVDLTDIAAAAPALQACVNRLPTRSREETADIPAKPLSLAGWIRGGDFTAGEMRASGVARLTFRLRIGTDGVPVACEVTNTADAGAFGEKACKLLVARARFTPATNYQGKTVQGTFHRTVAFQPPR